MSNVTPSAETSAPSAQNTAFSWTFSGAPIRVQIPLSLVARLRSELHQLGSKKEGQFETGGILIGSQKSAALIEIEDYYWALAENPNEACFQLDKGILKRMRSGTLNLRAGAATSPVVGYFRTQAGGNLRLRAEELSVVREQFADPSNVVLLIDTKSKPYNAGFFFWMESNAFTPFSLRDFPLDPEILGLQEQPAAAAVRRASTRAAVPVVTEEKMPQAYPSVEQHAALADPEPEVVESPPARPRLPAIAIGLGLAAVSMGGVAILNLGWRPSVPLTAAPARSPLQLEVEEQGGGLNVRWNPQAPAMAQARSGSLQVREGDEAPRVISLDRQQISAGHVFYRSAAARLQFDLAVEDTSGSVTRDSVLALSSKTLAAADSRAPEPAGSTAARSPDRRPAAGRQIPPAPARSSPARIFVPPTRTVPAAVPAVALTGPQIYPTVTLATPPAVSAALTRLPETAPPSGTPMFVSENIQSAYLVRRIAPVYPAAAVASNIRGSVQFTALIGKDGTIRGLHAVSGNPILSAAAEEAVKQWVYRPTLVRGAPVEVMTRIEIEFTPPR